MEYFIALFAAAALFAHVRLSGTELIPTGPVQYFLHKLYAIAEPQILRLIDFLITKDSMTGTLPGRFILKTIAVMGHYFPHGIVLTTGAAERFMDYIANVEGPGGARIAVGPCVCQRSLDKWKEPSCKDIVVLYGADIYYHLNIGYRIISANEAKKLLRECRDAGLVHTLDFCMQSGKWTFVVCNCDEQICVLYRTWQITGKFMYPGPEIAVLDSKKCLGEKKCGMCLIQCSFGAITATGSEPSFNSRKCMGCGLCVLTCKGKARSMVMRKDFRHGAVLPPSIIMPVDVPGQSRKHRGKDRHGIKSKA